MRDIGINVHVVCHGNIILCLMRMDGTRERRDRIGLGERKKTRNEKRESRGDICL